MKARLLVVQHEDECPPGWFGEWLEDAGIGLDVVAGHRGEPIPESTAGYDGLLVLGGAMGAYDDVPCPWLVPTRRLITRTVAEGSPFLGVCLGHQLATVALGGAVGRNPAGQATGLTDVRLTDEGRADPLLGVVAAGQQAVQWNEDVVCELPPTATALAFARDGSVQAVRFGPRAWGVQFHPEVSPEIFASWTSTGPDGAGLRADGVDKRAAAVAVRAARADLRAGWRPMAERFGEIVGSTTAMVPKSAPSGSAPSGSAAPGSAAPGSAAPGSVAPGSVAPGSAASGSVAPR